MSQALARDTEFEFSEDDFQWLRATANAHSGIVLADAKRNMIYSRLSKRLRKLKLRSFADYRKLLKSGDEAEFAEFINAITTNLTSFFREAHHFEHLSQVAIPETLRSIAGQRKLRIWSAGCSTGEEPYTIGMVTGECLGARSDQAELVATDLDTRVLEEASQGIYDASRATGLGDKRLRRWFLRGSGQFSGKVRVKPELRKPIRFEQLNLTQDWKMAGPFDVIFCRNVVIYFDKATQHRLFARFAEVLRPGGYLYIGHSETLHQISDQFRLVGKTTYQRVPTP
jgi:chemotaxis protein methyltransferase CheR